MLRSMYSGISGMKVNQTKLDVIGNNIANVGTTAYKSSSARFSEMLNQNVKEASSPSNNKGGTNAAQVGLGVQLSSICKVMSQGALQTTNRTLDLAIDGNGFFMVSKGPEISNDSTLEVNHQNGNHSITTNSSDNSNSEILYTRDGAFTLDQEGNLLTADGYRILGYSLTNDDNTIEATSETPSTITLAGLDITFGPGTQLNNYKITLGNVGPGTVASANVNNDKKIITINGDFSTQGTLTKEKIELAINKGLSASGISQTAEVNGKPITIAELSSNKITNGSNAISPDSIKIAGLTLNFSEGSELNEYSVSIRNIKEGTPLNVDIDTNTKKIIIDADFINKGAITINELQDSINSALNNKNIKQNINNITGNISTLQNTITTTNSQGSDLKAINSIIEKSNTSSGSTFGGLTLNFEDGEQLNGYTIKFGETTSGEHKVFLNKTDKTITISGNMQSSDALENIKKAFNLELNTNNITSNRLNSIAGKFDENDVDNTLKLSGGSDFKAPNNINLLNSTITLPKGENFNNVKFEIKNINADNLTVNYEKATKTFSISGNFVSAGFININDLTAALNEAAEASGDFSNITNNNKITVSGNLSTINDMKSNIISGGMELKKPNSINILGMTGELTAGGDLNDYTIEIGNISAGTQTNATIDTTNKKIIINTDMVNNSTTNNISIQNAINKALLEKSISQTITITGTSNSVDNIQSNEIKGGTPIQSIGENGIITFVDATKNVSSYDESLKTLKIPESVKIPGSNTELKITSYSIDKNGIISGVLENGQVAALGQIAMGTFRNPEGLKNAGDNLYSQSVNSGECVIKTGIGTANSDNSSAYGDLCQGYLEASNVDLAEEFTNMIVTSRAFQANSKIINTGDELLQEIINLKR